MDTAENKLRNEKIPKLVLGYALSTFAALIFNSVYNLTDALFVSWGVGANASGAISVVMPFVLVQSAISTALGGGAATLISVKFGEGKTDEGGAVALNAMIAFYVTALAVTAIGFLSMEPLLKIMGVTDDLYVYAKEYFIIILAANVFSTGFSSIIRAEGKMLYGLLIWVIPISVNIILDAVLILVLGWGVKGSAFATVICQFTSFSMMALFFLKFSRLNFKRARLSFKTIGSILQMGIPSLVQIGALSAITLVINFELSRVGGTLGVNAFAFVNKLIAFAIVPFTALAQAIMPIISFNYGANNPARAKETLRFALIASLIYAVLAAALAEGIPSYLMMIFTKDADIIAVGETAVRILAPSLIFTPLPYLLGASFQAQKRKTLSLALYVSNLIFLLPFVFALPLALDVNGVWLSYVLGAVCASVFSAVILLISRRRADNIRLPN